MIVGGKPVHCSDILCLQAEGLGSLSPGQGGFATTPWVVHTKTLQSEGLRAIVTDFRLAAFQAAGL